MIHSSSLHLIRLKRRVIQGRITQHMMAFKVVERRRSRTVTSNSTKHRSRRTTQRTPTIQYPRYIRNLPHSRRNRGNHLTHTNNRLRNSTRRFKRHHIQDSTFKRRNGIINGLSPIRRPRPATPNLQYRLNRPSHHFCNLSLTRRKSGQLSFIDLSQAPVLGRPLHSQDCLPLYQIELPTPNHRFIPRVISSPKETRINHNNQRHIIRSRTYLYTPVSPAPPTAPSAVKGGTTPR